MIIYAETGLGACIHEARDLRTGARQILKEVGTYHGVQLVRKATKEDINYVYSMGGWLPQHLREGLDDRNKKEMLRHTHRRKRA